MNPLCRKNPPRPPRRARGFTLVELMVAMTIGLILSGSVIQMFLGNRQTYRAQDASSRMQETARFAFDTLAHDLRMAGYQGCPSLRAVTPRVTASPALPAFTAATTVRGYQASGSSWTPSLPAALSGTLLGADVVSIQFTEGCAAHLTSTMASASADVEVSASNTCAIAPDDALLISDCGSADIFRVSAVSSASGVQRIAHATSRNTSAELSKAYGTEAEVFRVRSYTYYLAPNPRGIPALWRLDNTLATGTDNPLEMSEDIEDLQLRYGEDTDSPPDQSGNRHVTANAVSDWGNVVSLRVTVRVRSGEDQLASAPRTVSFNGADLTDHRLRKDFTATIAARNQLP
jgi:type IV pilus assembly protein PilW